MFAIDSDVPAKALPPVSKLEARARLSLGFTAWHKNTQKSRLGSSYDSCVCVHAGDHFLAVPVLSLPPCIFLPEL